MSDSHVKHVKTEERYDITFSVTPDQYKKLERRVNDVGSRGDFGYHIRLHLGLLVDWDED